MHAVAHDDHPGDAGDPGVLHLLVRVAVPPVGVAVRVSVLLGLASVLLVGGRVLLAGYLGCQRGFVGGRVRRLEL